MSSGTTSTATGSAHVVERATHLPFPPAAVFGWHERPGALERLIPPWERAVVVERTGGIRDGDRVVLKVGGPLGMRWVARHVGFEQDRQFADEQVEGPFGRWRHLHRFEPDGPAACVMTDRVEYTPPLGAIGEAGDPLLIRPRVERMLGYRHEVVRRDLETHAAYGDRARLRIAVTGASGLIGRALIPFLTTGGHTVVRIVRHRSRNDQIVWDYHRGRVDRSKLEGLDAVIHLAGEPIGVRWTKDRRRKITESRGIGTRFLAEALAWLERPPKVLISASAIGVYGNRGDATLTERSAQGTPPDFLTEVTREWEAGTEPARSAGIRTVLPRFGIVLSPAGGALERMLTPFRLGVGGPLGSGRQYMSWIAMDDLIAGIHHTLMTDGLSGPVNLTAPNPVTNEVFAQTLGRVLERPALVPVPAQALSLAFGEMARVTILSSARVLPERLLATGYAFRYPQLEGALRFILGRPAPAAPEH
jgi:uncharacterized protein (TIGR01777 family)